MTAEIVPFDRCFVWPAMSTVNDVYDEVKRRRWSNFTIVIDFDTNLVIVTRRAKNQEGELSGSKQFTSRG